MKPTLDEIIRDPVIYATLRREELAADGIARRWRALVAEWSIGWRWWLARGPWSSRPQLLRWAWWVGVPFVGRFCWARQSGCAHDGAVDRVLGTHPRRRGMADAHSGVCPTDGDGRGTRRTGAADCG